MKRSLVSILYIVLTAQLVGCLPQINGTTTPQVPGHKVGQPATAFEQGQEDGGGGEVFLSSKENVRQEIQRAWKYALYPNYMANPLQRFAEWQWSRGRDSRVEQILTQVFDPSGRLRNLSEGEDDANLRRNGYVYFWEYLKSSALEIRDEPCSGGGKVHTDAAVSSNRIGATICFSVASLQKIPSHALLSEISTMLVHELVHINGFDEEAADSVQALASAYFGATMGEVAVNLQRDEFRNGVGQAISDLQLIENAIGPDQMKFSSVMNSIVERLRLAMSYSPLRGPGKRSNGFQRNPFRDSTVLEIVLNVNSPLCLEMIKKIKNQERTMTILTGNREEGEDTEEVPPMMRPERFGQTMSEIKTVYSQLREVENMAQTCFAESAE